MIDKNEIDDDICELYDLSPSPYVKRSHFYHLPPVGVGTPYVESLTSYISRLAQAHHVLPKSLVKHVIIPILDSPVISKQQHEKLGIIWKMNTRTLNGISAITSSWVHVLEELTLRNDLQFLTMLPWSNVLSKSKLVRHYRAWCPYCLKEKKELGHIIYEPLIWCVDAVKTCSIHNISLTIHCPNPRCQQLTSPFTREMQPGYCSQCQSWLGEDSKVERTPSQTEHNGVDQAWLVQAVQELLVAAPLLSNVISRQQAAAAFQPYLDQLAEGTISILARHIRQKTASLGEWIKGRSMPRLATFLDICYHLKTTPLAFLTQDPDTLSIEKDVQSIDTGTDINLRNYRRKTKQLQQLLEECLTEYPPLSLGEVARKSGRQIQLLRSYFPDVCQKIVVRHREYLDKMRMRARIEDMLSFGRDISIQMILDKLQCTDQFIQQEFPDLWKEIVLLYECTVDIEAKRIALETALLDQHCPSLRVVGKSVGCSVKALRQDFPELSRLVDSRHRASFDSEVVRHQLEAILNDPSQVLTLSEIIRQTGYSGKRIRQYFPDLCSALIEKYSFPDLDSVKKELENVLAHSTRESLAGIACRVGYSSDKIRGHFPDLVAAIIANHKLDVELFQQTLEHLLASNTDPLPSLHSIALSLDVTVAILQSSCPSLYKQIVERRKLQQSNQNIQEYLEEALMSTITPPVSCTELARQLGVSTTIFRNTYPDLYKALVERYRDYRHKNKLERKNHIKIQVQTAIELAAAESPSPSASDVGKHLSKRSIMRDPEVASMVREGLKNLTR